ncbi:germ cell nuclear acidic protein-like [Rhinoderma darwinii]|uniref:germ cell nuclear acidic protein-like n=1 Tax=Rhinoderma darwinii TaxID=43563 RepID=UPI003F67ECB0
MAKKKRFERIIVLSDSEDASSDEDLHQPRPRKKPRLPNQEQEGGFNTGLTPRQPDINTPLPSSSNDIYRSNNVIVISDDDDDDFRSEETPIRKRLRTSDTEATDASKQWESPVVSDSDDDDCVIITPTTAVTDKDPVEYLEDPTSEERRPKCNIHNCFIEDITSSTSPYMTHFQATKQELVTRLYKLYNQTVFNNQLPDKLQITWSKRLTATSARCCNVRGDVNQYSKIEISEKVCDSADRVRDALVHEMCHAACWLINGVQKDGHGKLWKSYAQSVTRVHPELPPVNIYHTYDINYKYNYVCEWCLNRVGRFTSLKDERAHCRFCGGRLLLMNTTENEDMPSTSHHTPYSQTFRENCSAAKRTASGINHQKPMQRLNSGCSIKRKRSAPSVIK